MRSLTLALALAVTLAGAGAARATEAGGALDFVATALDGSLVQGSDLAGKAVLLDFWGTWCPPCIAAFPKLLRLQEEHVEDLRVQGLAFFSGDGDEVAGFLERRGIEGYSTWLGGDELIEKFDILAFPSYVLISAEGEIVFVQIGEFPDIAERVGAYFEPGG